MDRREALKKLGAGGALIAASPVILPTVGVAHAASPGETDLVGVPDAGEPLPYTEIEFPNNRWGKKQITLAPDMSGVECTDQSLPIITYEWRIVSVMWDKAKVAFLRITEATTNPQDPAGAQLAVTPPSTSGFSGPTAYSAPSYANGFLLRKGTAQGDRNFDKGDRYAVEMRVRWHCDGATSDIEAEYVFNGIATDTVTVTNSSWNIVPA